MKIIASAVLCVLLLISGINLTLDVHYCSGNMAAIKFSVTGEVGTCGMEKPHTSRQDITEFSYTCCRDKSAAYDVDHQYLPSYFNLNKVFQKIIHVFVAPVIEKIYLINTAPIVNTVESPPGFIRNILIHLDFLCVFRI